MSLRKSLLIQVPLCLLLPSCGSSVGLCFTHRTCSSSSRKRIRLTHLPSTIFVKAQLCCWLNCGLTSPETGMAQSVHPSLLPHFCSWLPIRAVDWWGQIPASCVGGHHCLVLGSPTISSATASRLPYHSWDEHSSVCLIDSSCLSGVNSVNL